MRDHAANAFERPGRRIALVTPTYWPEVRRGTERVVHELGTTLAARGHDVTLITTHAHPSTVSIEEGMRVKRARRVPQPPGFAAHEYHLTSVPSAFRSLTHGAWDIAHCFFPSSSWAALRARSFGGPPVIASTHGIPTREYLVARRYRLEMHQEIARRADEVSVLSAAAARPYRRYLLREPAILTGGVRTDEFAPQTDRHQAPTIFCASSLGDPRKRADLLFRAFASLRRERPRARLLIASTPDPFMSKAAPTLPSGASWLDVSAPGALARAYGEAWTTVNPAIGEAFGLIMVESLAAGTPVVADSSGAAPEILTEATGRLFRPDNDADLARALAEGLDLAEASGTQDACRDRAADFDWDLVVQQYEDSYEQVIRGIAPSS